MSSAEMLKSANMILDFNPTHIIFTDHKPHPLPLLNLILKSPGNNTKFKIIFHVFGDFCLNLGAWKKVENLISNRNILFYAASKRQLKAISMLVNSANVRLCPFPLETKEFGFSEEVRRQARKKFKWGNEKVFLYTGRLSRQKQTLEMMVQFADWIKKKKCSARLVFVGEFDELGEPYSNRGEWIGEYFHETMNYYNSLPKEVRNKIEFHGFKSNKELKAYYSASDAFVSLSVHNDEDFGMSCAEALASGLPLIITDWAGYASFAYQKTKDHIYFIPVTIGPEGKFTDLNMFQKSLDIIIDRDSVLYRKEIIKSIYYYLSVENVSSIVKKDLRYIPLFSKFTPLLKKASTLEEQFWGHTFYNERARKFNDIYLRIYVNYVATNS
jgi:hypothetical protein